MGDQKETWPKLKGNWQGQRLHGRTILGELKAFRSSFCGGFLDCR